MKNKKRDFLLLFATISLLITSFQAKAENDKIKIVGYMPTWQMIVSEKATKVGNNEIAKALARDKEVSKNNLEASSRGIKTYGGLSLIAGTSALTGATAYEINITMTGAQLVLSIGASQGRGNGADFEYASQQLAPYYSFFNDFQSSNLSKDLTLIAYNILPSLNAEISTQEAFVNSAGLIQDIQLDLSTGLLKSFTTSEGINFVRKEENNVIWYEGTDMIYKQNKKLYVMFTFAGNEGSKK